MRVLTKAPAVIEPGDDDQDLEHGSFHVILSAPTLDRDGEVLKPDEWKRPLPDHITFDIDHGMTVSTTVGSGVPSLEDDGTLHVRGTYSSLPRAQEVRTLVKEKHIRSTSVAFMTERTPTKDGKTTVVRELLNGAFVAVPSNREAIVLDSKGAKEGRRNNADDSKAIQAIHDHSRGLGATCSSDEKALGRKDFDDDPATMVAAVDAALDEAGALLATVDTESLPAEVQQAISLVAAAGSTVDELMEALGIQDPDDDTGSAAEDSAESAADKAADTAEDDAAEQIALRARALIFRGMAA
jgi:hypothetical protein